MNTMDCLIISMKWWSDIDWLIRLQNEVANKISRGENLKENTHLNLKIWAAIKEVRQQLDEIISLTIFNDEQ
jgi:hypothetical protein